MAKPCADGVRRAAAHAGVGLERWVPERQVRVADAVLHEERRVDRDDLGTVRPNGVDDGFQHVGEGERRRWAHGVEGPRVATLEQLEDPAGLVPGVDHLDSVAGDVRGNHPSTIGNAVDPVGEPVRVVVRADDVRRTDDDGVGVVLGDRAFAQHLEAAVGLAVDDLGGRVVETGQGCVLV